MEKHYRKTMPNTE